MQELNDHTESLIHLALEEDLGDLGDITSEYWIEKPKQAFARLTAKQEGSISGMEVVARVFKLVDERVEFEASVVDGEVVEVGDILFEVRGNVHSLLKAERTALNFLQKLSGIASLTQKFINEVAGSGIKIYDTRKTVPAWRTLSKKAVVDGGGCNHRTGLFDQVLLKDNHLVEGLSLKDLQGKIDQFKKIIPN